MKVTKATIPFGASNLELSSGEIAKQASGSVLVQHGETVLLVTACVSREDREGADFFPLSVDYEERMYAAGKISGSRFIKREGRPSEEAILKARIIDRSIRPMFPKGFRKEVQIIITTLSYDEQFDTSAMAIIGASAALLQTDAPFEGPIGAVRIGLTDDNFVLNPVESQMSKSPLDLLVAGTAKKITMIESESSEIPEEKMLKAFSFAQDAISQTLDPQSVFISSEKDRVEFVEPEVIAEVKKKHWDKILKISTELDVPARFDQLDELKVALIEEMSDQDPVAVKQAIDTLFLKAVRSVILVDKKRPDGRAFDEVRKLDIKVGVLPRVHGSAIFARGETQILTVTTLGGPKEEQWVDTLEQETTKRYMHHYNFAPFATGEIKRMGGGNRREIGHGSLAEKALARMIPDKESFPYTIRLVSETLGSNGSSSMAAVCGSTLSLMDAGVPLIKPVAGIAMGLVSDSDTDYQVLTDLQGLEDFAGEMDFKIAGTGDGITAIQLDVKNKGLTEVMLRDILTAAHKARTFIMEEMLKVIPAPRQELSPNAPRIITTTIDPTKIGELIGPGGKTINKIIDSHGGREIVSVDIEDDGLCMITSKDTQIAQAVKAIVEGIGRPIEIGQEFEGPVVQIVKDRNSGKEIGAIVQLTPNRDGMIHISALGNGQFVQNVSSLVKVGDTLKVRVKDVDSEKGRISLVRI